MTRVQSYNDDTLGEKKAHLHQSLILKDISDKKEFKNSKHVLYGLAGQPSTLRFNYEKRPVIFTLFGVLILSCLLFHENHEFAEVFLIADVSSILQHFNIVSYLSDKVAIVSRNLIY